MNVFSSEFLGRLHPLLIHLPIAALMLAALVELWMLIRETPAAPTIVRFLSAVGAAGAVIAAGTGWLFAHEHHRGDIAALLDQHRWLGLATVMFAIVAWLAVRAWPDATSPRKRWMRRAAVWGAAVTLVVASHLGAVLVWGTDYFSP